MYANLRHFPSKRFWENMLGNELTSENNFDIFKDINVQSFGLYDKLSIIFL